MKLGILSAALAAAVCISLAGCSSATAAVESPSAVSSESAAESESVDSSEARELASSAVQSEPLSAPSEEQVSEENSAEISAEELEAARKKFQTVFEQTPITGFYGDMYSDCKRYTIVSDYDGDGKLEAFGFVGVESDWQPAPYWESISIYYISSDYTVTALAGGDSEYDTVNGGIRCPEPNYAADFANCVYTSGKEHFLAWSVAYWDSDWFALILGVHDGKPVLSYPGETFFVNDNGQFATFDNDYNEVLLQLKDGEMVKA